MQVYKTSRYVFRSSIASDTINLLWEFFRQFVPRKDHPVVTNIADVKLARFIWNRVCVSDGTEDGMNVCVCIVTSNQ